MIRCNDCNQIFSKKCRLIRHKETQDGCRKALDLYKFSAIYTDETQPLSKKKKEKEFICKICKKIYKRKFYYDKHLSVHEDEIRTSNIQNNITNINNIDNSTNNINNLTVNIKMPFLPINQMKNVISKEQFLKILNYEKVDDVIQELIRLTYFSKESPENNYWCVTFPAQKFGALQYNPKTENIERWLTKEVIDYHFEGMMFCICPVMDDLYQKEIYSTLNTVQKRNLNILYNYFGIKNLSSKYPNDYEKIKMLAYNNKHIPISFWKKLNFENRLDLQHEIPIQIDY